MEELITKIFAITSFVAAAMTILAIVIAVIVILVSGIKKAKAPDSPGGSDITAQEAKDLLLKLLPLAIKSLFTAEKVAGKGNTLCDQDQELTKE